MNTSVNNDELVTQISIFIWIPVINKTVLDIPNDFEVSSHDRKNKNPSIYL